MPRMPLRPRGMVTSNVATFQGPAASGGAKLSTAAASMSGMRVTAGPGLGRSLSGWPGRRNVAVREHRAAGLAGRAVVREYLAVPDQVNRRRTDVALAASAAMD